MADLGMTVEQVRAKVFEAIEKGVGGKATLTSIVRHVFGEPKPGRWTEAREKAVDLALQVWRRRGKIAFDPRAGWGLTYTHAKAAPAIPETESSNEPEGGDA